MKKRLTSIFLAAISALTACSVNSSDNTPQANTTDTANESLDPEMFPRCSLGDFSLCGYVDAKIWDTERRNEIRIPAKFETAKQFNEGVALVRVGGKYGYIDHSGDYIITPRFIGASSFRQGLATVIVGDQIGVINLQGEFVVEPRFSSATLWGADRLIAKDGRIPAAFLRTDRSIESLINTGLRGRGADRGVFDIKARQWLLPQAFQFSQFSKTSTELIWANRKGKNSGLVAKDGRWRLEPRYSHVQPLHENRAVIAVKDNESGEQKWGAVDETGQLVFAPQFSWLSYWNNGYGLTRKGDYGDPNTTHGLVDAQGNLVGDAFFEQVRRPETAGELPQVKVDGNWHVITKSGALGPIPEAAPEAELYLECETYSYRRESGGYVAVNPQDTRIADLVYTTPPSFFVGPASTNTRPRCDHAHSLYSEDKGVAVIMPDGALFADRLFENAHALSGDVLSYSDDKKWGLIDQDGNIIVQPQYDRISWSDQDMFLAVKDDVKFFMDLTGQTKPIKSHPRYNAKFNLIMQPREGYLTCPNGSMLARKNGKWGMIGAEGETLIAFNHAALSCYTRGVAWAPIEAKQQWCPIGINGEFDESRTCMDTYYLGPSITHHYPQKLDENPFKSSVLWNKRYLGYGAGDNASPPHYVGDGVQGHRDWLTPPLVTKR